MRNLLIKQSGFTLIEVLIAITLFGIISVGVYVSYSNVLDITIASQINSVGLTVIANELEVVRNMDYLDVGIQGGAPAGLIPAEKNVDFAGFNFILKTTVRNIDDVFDGQLGGTPNDTAPADYKIIEMELLCTSCARFIPLKSTTTVSPVGLESSATGGNLFVKAIDASGQPLAGMNVSVTNTEVNPAININDTTNNNGELQLVDIPISSLAYQITVSKAGYSTEQTYEPGASPNPNPTKPHATVVFQNLTEVTFSVDKLSTQNFKTRDKFCQPVSNIAFNQKGTKLIGTEPDVLKYSFTGQTDIDGLDTNSNIEWDSYTLQNIDTNYDLAGTTLLSPFGINPDTIYNVNWLMETKDSSSLLVIVQDDEGQLIDDANITFAKVGFSEDRVSGHNYFGQTDWSGGQFSQKSQNIEDNLTTEIELKNLGGKYATQSIEWVESETFDMGISANFYVIKWNPESQPPQTGAESLKFQIATNDDNLTWNYVGPDGSAETFYTNSGETIYNDHSGDRYYRYKAYLITQDELFTPTFDDIEIEFSSACIPSGQSFFSGLSSGTYTLTIQKTGYQDYTAEINIGSGWQEHRAVLTP